MDLEETAAETQAMENAGAAEETAAEEEETAEAEETSAETVSEPTAAEDVAVPRKDLKGLRPLLKKAIRSAVGTVTINGAEVGFVTDGIIVIPASREAMAEAVDKYGAITYKSIDKLSAAVTVKSANLITNGPAFLERGIHTLAYYEFGGGFATVNRDLLKIPEGGRFYAFPVTDNFYGITKTDSGNRWTGSIMPVRISNEEAKRLHNQLAPQEETTGEYGKASDIVEMASNKKLQAATKLIRSMSVEDLTAAYQALPSDSKDKSIRWSRNSLATELTNRGEMVHDEELGDVLKSEYAKMFPNSDAARAFAETGYAGTDMTNDQAFDDGQTSSQYQIRPPYTDGTKSFNEFVDGLSDEARKTYDLFRAMHDNATITNVIGMNGKTVRKINISAPYLTVDEWNARVADTPKWKEAAMKIASLIPDETLRNMGFNKDGTLNKMPLEEEFKMKTSLSQRLIDALPLESISRDYVIDGKTIRLETAGANQSVGGEAYRRALLDETRKAYQAGKLRQVNISGMAKDAWGAMGFLAVNGKTGASGDFTTLCPQMMFNRGCFYCYRRAAMESGVNNKLVARSVWYTGEILKIKDSDIEMLNKNGGLRIQSFGDWMPYFSAQLADLLYDAETRGLQVKIITKEPSMIEYIASLRKQGIGQNLYFNLSADYAIEKAPANIVNQGNKDLGKINPNRPFMRDEAQTMWWKRAMTVEEANEYRKKYPWVNTRIVATRTEEFLRGLKDPTVDVVTGYHGHIREYERIDSTTGEKVLNVEPLGDSGMPRFRPVGIDDVANTPLYQLKNAQWEIEYPGKTKVHQQLAQAIHDAGLEFEYYVKTCCITGRCASCNGKCGAVSRGFAVKNATNRDSVSRLYWAEKMLSAIDNPVIDSYEENHDPQYSMRITNKDLLGALKEEFAKGEYDEQKNPDGGYITVYRSVQIIDGKMYAPMNAVDRDENGKNKKLGFASEFGVFEQATESPEIAQRYMDEHPGAKYAKFDLDGVDNKTGGVAYNPYLHASNLVLNDQLAASYRRNLKVIECRVPVSEAGAYHAKYAKDTTGWVNWKPGGVAGKLAKLKPEYARKLFVSRYMLPVREVPAAEVARMYKEYLSGTDLTIPWNVVTPELRHELEKIGVPIDYKDVKAGKNRIKFSDMFPNDVQYSMRYNPSAVPGVNINDSTQAFTDDILARLKTVETREANANAKHGSLSKYVGHRVGLVRTGKGKAMLVGWADIVQEIEYGSEEEFRADYDRHRIAKGSDYDWHDGKKKFGYVLENVTAEENPYEVTEQGIIVRDVDREAQTHTEIETETKPVKISNADYLKWVDVIPQMSDEVAKRISQDPQQPYIQISSQTPQILRDSGADNLPLVIRFDSLYLAERKNGSVNGHYHDLGKTVMTGLYDDIANADIVLETRVMNKDGTPVLNRNGEPTIRLVAISRIDTKTGQLMASIEINTVKDADTGNNFYNVVVTAFDINPNYVRNQIRDHGARIKKINEAVSQVNPKHLTWLGTINEAASLDPMIPELMQLVNRENDDGVQEQQRSVGDTEILRLASNEYREQLEKDEKLTDAEISALDILNKRLDDLSRLEEERQKQGQLYRQQQFGITPDGEKVAVDREAAEKTKARMEVLDGKINKAANAVLRAKNTDVLKGVLVKARRVVESVERDRAAERLKAYRERRNEDAAASVYRAKIHRDIQSLTKWIINPGNKEALRSVPDALKSTVIPFLASIDPTSKQKLRGRSATKADIEYERTLQKLKDVLNASKESGELYNGYNDLPENFIQTLDSLINDVREYVDQNSGEYVVNQMNSEQLKNLHNVIKVLKKYIQNVNRFLGNAMVEHVYEAGQSSMTYMQQLAKEPVANDATNYVLWQNARPIYGFDRFGEGGEAVYDGFRRGQDQLAFDAKQIIDFVTKLYEDNGINVRELENDVREIRLNDEMVKIPVSHIMGLYELAQRPQALGHLLGDGLRVATYKNGKTVVNDTGHILQREDVERITSQLTPAQKYVADQLQQFMAKVGGAWGNSVYVKRFGVERFGDPNYYPIASDRLNFAATADAQPSQASLYALLNMSFTKDIVEGANNRIMLYSIFDVFTNHMTGMAQYHSMALPVLDALKWLNYDNGMNSVRKEMRRAYGAPVSENGSERTGYAETFVLNMLKSLNGTAATGDTYDSLGLNMLHKYNAAQVAYNLRVVMQQPMAITRAGLVVSGRDIIRGLKLNPSEIRKNIAEMEKYSGIAVWKQLGFYDVNISRGMASLIKQDESVVENAIEIGTKGAELADRVTWAAMWSAAKSAVERTENIPVGTPQYYAAVTDLFEEIIYRTQVVDSVITKSEMMRSKSFFARSVSSFMNEPITTASMLISGYEKYRNDMRRGASAREAWQANKGYIGKVASVYAVGQVLLAVVQSIADAWRDDDDYETFLQKWWEAFKGNAIDNILPFDLLPIVSDLYQLAKTMIGKTGLIDTYGFEPNSVWMQWYNSLIKGWEIMWGKINGESKYNNYTYYSIIYNALKAVSGMTGIPVAAGVRELQTAWNNTIGSFAPSLKLKTYDRPAKTEITNAIEGGYIGEEAATKALVEDAGMTLPEAADYVSYVSYKRDTGEEFTQAQYRAYEKYAKDAGFGASEFLELMEEANEFHADVDADGKSVSGSKKKKVLDWINGLDITTEQKDALYYACNYAESKISDAPWH